MDTYRKITKLKLILLFLSIKSVCFGQTSEIYSLNQEHINNLHTKYALTGPLLHLGYLTIQQNGRYGLYDVNKNRIALNCNYESVSTTLTPLDTVIIAQNSNTQKYETFDKDLERLFPKLESENRFCYPYSYNNELIECSSARHRFNRKVEIVYDNNLTPIIDTLIYEIVNHGSKPGFYLLQEKSSTDYYLYNHNGTQKYHKILLNIEKPEHVNILDSLWYHSKWIGEQEFYIYSNTTATLFQNIGPSVFGNYGIVEDGTCKIYRNFKELMLTRDCQKISSFADRESIDYLCGIVEDNKTGIINYATNEWIVSPSSFLTNGSIHFFKADNIPNYNNWVVKVRDNEINTMVFFNNDEIVQIKSFNSYIDPLQMSENHILILRSENNQSVYEIYSKSGTLISQLINHNNNRDHLYDIFAGINLLSDSTVIMKNNETGRWAFYDLNFKRLSDNEYEKVDKKYQSASIISVIKNNCFSLLDHKENTIKSFNNNCNGNFPKYSIDKYNEDIFLFYVTNENQLEKYQFSLIH